MKFTWACHEVSGCKNMSTPEDPGWAQSELNGKGQRPRARGGIAFKCDACLSKAKESGERHSRIARSSAARKTLSGVVWP